MDASTSHLLAILVVPAVLGFSWLFLATLLEAPEPEHTFRSFDATSLEILTISDAFDPERRVLWTSQVPLLQAISSDGSFGACLRVCDNCLRRYPELYEGTSAESWLRLLQRNNLAEVAGMRIRLTNDGRELLRLLLYQTSRAVSRN
ncbi:MAG: hypothetical protein ABSD20_07990 [Terriglobales bacterium]|jgi:hypothetical protein